MGCVCGVAERWWGHRPVGHGDYCALAAGDSGGRVAGSKQQAIAPRPAVRGVVPSHALCQADEQTLAETLADEASRALA